LMKDNRLWLKQRSIKFSLLLLLTIITTATVVSMTWIAVSSTGSQGRMAQEISTEALTSQAKDYLLQLTLSSVRENDLVLTQVKNDAQKLASYAAAVFQTPSAFQTANYWNPQERLFQGPDGQHLNRPEDMSSVFLPNFQELDEEVLNHIELSAYLDLVFESVMKTNPEIEAIYFATDRDMVRYYPNVNLGMRVPPDFTATKRVWYAGSLPDKNPEGKAWWTPPYVDATGLGLVTTAAAPAVDENKNIIGVVGFDITLKGMVSRIEAAHVLKSGYSFLIDGSGKAIALPPQGYLHILGRQQGTDEINTDLTTSTTGFASIIARMMRGGSGIERLEIGGQELFVAYAPLESTGWSLASVVETRDVIQAVGMLQDELGKSTSFLLFQRVLPVSLVIFLSVILLGLVITNRIVNPVQQLARASQEILDGRWEVKLPTDQKNEIGLLALTFQEMTQQIHCMVRDLEQRVHERTRDLERRSNQLKLAAEIARDATAIRELDVLLDRTVNLVRERFGFYHVGIFLLDHNREYAYFRAGTGEAGSAMLQTGHRLKVGEVGIVGYVTSTGKPRISLEVSGDSVHFKNPLLEATRSEMALPLMVDNKVIGALDVQSELPSAFDEEDIHILQVMADQLAVGIENVRLYQEAQENLKQLEAMYDSYNQEAWKRIEQTKRVVGYRYEPFGITPLLPGDGEQHSSIPSHEAHKTLLVPLKVRGRLIGELEVTPQQESLTNDELVLLTALGERVSQALESARLFEESQARAAREQTLNQLSASFTHSLDFDTLLKTAVVEMGRLPNVAEVSVHVGQPEKPGSGNVKSNGRSPSG
jgi:nitrate/nitrite-specific signal transduction histidine kinase